MSFPAFEFHRAGSYEEAFALRARYGEEARYIAGGTALALLMRAQLLYPTALLGIGGLPGLRELGCDGGDLRIGAGLRHAELAASPEVKRLFPALAETFAHVATPRVRNMATVGGNLAHANPHQDPPVTLTALDARIVARGPAGERRIPIGDFFLGYFETSLEGDEILAAIEVPLPAPRRRTAFIKYLSRSADDYATVNVAVSLERAEDRIESPRIVIGSMGATPLRAREAEELLSGRRVEPERLAEAGKAAAAITDPELDSRGSPEYKRRIAPVIVRRAIEAAWSATSAG